MRALVSVSLVLILGCAGERIAIDPRWRAKIYAGSLFDQGVVRHQSGEVIRWDNEAFPDLRCVRSEDLDRLYRLLQECRELREIYEVDKLFE